MVVAGVVPVDQLVDVRAPIQVIVDKMGLNPLEQFYGLQMSKEAVMGRSPSAPQATEVLSALALSRGWVQVGGLPDETRAGRQMCKDFVNGKLLYCETPPAFECALMMSQPSDSVGKSGSTGLEQSTTSAAAESSNRNTERVDVQADDRTTEATSLGPGDADLLQSMAPSGNGPQRQRRPDYKFHKKVPKGKGNRGRHWDDQDVSGDVRVMLAGRKGSLRSGMLA